MLGGPSFSALLFPFEFSRTEASQPWNKMQTSKLGTNNEQENDRRKIWNVNLYSYETVMEMHPE
jgi:hypothetical protein